MKCLSKFLAGASAGVHGQRRRILYTGISRNGLAQRTWRHRQRAVVPLLRTNLEQSLSVNSQIQIQVVDLNNRKQLKQFIYFPRQLYRGKLYSGHAGGKQDPFWVPPMWRDEFELFTPNKHPIHKHAAIQPFLAMREGSGGKKQVFGRIAAIKDELYIETRGRQAGYYGFFECVPDGKVARTLQEAACDWCRERGLNEIIGPISPNPNHIIGFLCNHFVEPPVVQTPYNPEYYLDFFGEEQGWHKEMAFYAYRIDRNVHQPSERAFRVAKLAKERNKDLEIRPINLKDFWTDVEYIREIWNEAWLDHSEFVPWPEDEFRFMAKNLKMIANPKLAKIAFIKGEPAGFVIPLPNINEALIKSGGHLTPQLLIRLLKVRKGGDWLRMAILGVREKFQKGGIEAIMLCEAYTTAIEMGYQHADMSFVTEENDKLLKLLDHMNFWRYREYKTFRKAL